MAKKKRKKQGTGKMSKKKAKQKKSKKTARKSSAKPAPVKEEKKNSVNVYLTFNGNCEEAFNFYRSVFGGSFSYIGRFRDMPPAPGKELPPGQGDKIMHVSLPISKETSIMGSDSSDEFGHATVMGNNFSLSVNCISQAEADRIYNALANGGKAVMPMNKTFWGAYFGMLTDKFGISWMVNYDFNQP